MIRFTSLTLRNFLSYGNNTTVVELDRSGTTLIVGEDLDNTSNGHGANGVGKTVIINALAYAVYDKPLSSISKDNLVNNVNKKNMEVTINFDKDGVFYQVKRVRKSKSYAAGNYVKLYERVGDAEFTEADEVTRDSVSNTNKYIEKIIGIPYELFVRIVVFSANHIPFLDLPVRHVTAPSQTAIIEELFELTELAEDAEVLKVITKADDLKLSRLKDKIESSEREHIRHAKQVSSAKKRLVGWKNSNEEHIVDLKETLEKVSNIDIDTQRKLLEGLVTVEDELNGALENQRNIEKSIKKNNKKQKEIEKELEHLVNAKCPYCLQKYEDAQSKIDENKNAVEDLICQIILSTDDLDAADNKVMKLTKKHKLIKAKVTVPNIEELLEIKNQSSSITQHIEELNEAINPFVEPLEELMDIELDEIKYDEVNKLTINIEHQKFLLKLLTKKDSFVRKALLNKNIPFLNSRLQHYLSDLNLPHHVEFSHELIAQISRFGNTLDFGNLSNGQRARVNLALSFAFRDVLQKLHTRINVCMLDEALDVGLDSVGVQNAARMIKRKAREEGLSLYIISHRDEIDSAFDNQMTIQMIKGFSYIKDE